MFDLELATAQLESRADNKTQVGIVFENGFAVSPTDYGTLDHFEGLFVFHNSILSLTFRPSTASDVRLEDGVYQVRLKYGCGLLSFYERKATAEPFDALSEGES